MAVAVASPGRSFGSAASLAYHAVVSADAPQFSVGSLASIAYHGLLDSATVDRSICRAYSVTYIPPWAVLRTAGEVDLDYNDLEVELIFGGTR